MTRSHKAWAVVLISFIATAGADQASSPSVAVSGTPTYTISSDGVKMLFVNPYDCEKAATDASTWVIELEQPETVYSFQVALVGGDLSDDQEQITVRVGDSDPSTEGASSNSLCAVAELKSGSSMEEFECQQPVAGNYITVSRNDGGKMNVCGLSANLGTVALPPVNPLAPTVSVPAADLETPQTPEQMPLSPDSEGSLPILQKSGSLQSFAAVGRPVPAPAPGPNGAVLAPTPAPVSQVSVKSIPLLAMPTQVPAPAPAPQNYKMTLKVPAPAPTVVLPAKVPAPAPTVALPAKVPAPAPTALPPAEVPAVATPPVARNVFVAEEPKQTPPADTTATGQTGSAAAATPHSDNGLSGGAIAGIVIGCLAGVAIATVAAYVVYQKKHRTAGPQGHPLSSRVNPVYDA